MAQTRAKPSNYGVGDKVTSTELNTIDTNAAAGLDKRLGQTDTLQSICGSSGAGRLIPTTVTGANVDTTYTLSSGCSVILSGSLSAARSYTLSNTGAIAGDSVVVLGHATQTITVKNNAGTQIIKLGPLPAPATWAEFVYNGSAWILFKSNAPVVGARSVQFDPTTYTTTAVTPTTNTSWTTGESGATTARVTDTQVTKSSNTTTSLVTVNTGSSAGFAYCMPITTALVPDGLKLVSVEVYFANAAASLPTFQPCLGVLANTYNAVGSSSGKILMRAAGDFVQFAAGTNAAMNGALTWTADQNNTIERTAVSGTFTQYNIWFINEGGATAASGCGIRYVTITTSL